MHNMCMPYPACRNLMYPEVKTIHHPDLRAEANAHCGHIVSLITQSLPLRLMPLSDHLVHNASQCPTSIVTVESRRMNFPASTLKNVSDEEYI
jgi:hypothetical protein